MFFRSILTGSLHPLCNRITLHKWLAMVSLLLGEIPERSHFTQSGMRKALKPYFDITRAIRNGDLKAFQQVNQQYEEQFIQVTQHEKNVPRRH